MKSRNLNFREPSGPLQACNRTALTKDNHQKSQNNQHTGHNLNPSPRIWCKCYTHLIMKLRRMYDLVQKPMLIPHLTKYACKFHLKMKEKVICLALVGYYKLDSHFCNCISQPAGCEICLLFSLKFCGCIFEKIYKFSRSRLYNGVTFSNIWL